MKRLRFGLSCGLLLAASIACGQEVELGHPAPRAPELAPHPADIDPSTVAPEVYMYLQDLRRRDDPAQSVRRKAEARAEQRASRLQAMKWYGFSNARPQTSTVPMMSGVYSPAWSGNGFDRYDWSTIAGPIATMRIQHQHYDIRR